MTPLEFKQAMGPLTREFRFFQMSEERLEDWYREFGNESLDTLNKAVKHLVTNCQQAPAQRDLRSALNNAAGKHYDTSEPREVQLGQYNTYQQLKGCQRKTDGRVYWYERPSKLGFVTEVMGAGWVARQFQEEHGESLFRAMALGGPTSKRLTTWKEKAFRAAWTRKHGEFPTDEQMKEYV